jgi:hypothetical protein
MTRELPLATRLAKKEVVYLLSSGGPPSFRDPRLTDGTFWLVTSTTSDGLCAALLQEVRGELVSFHSPTVLVDGYLFYIFLVEECLK